MNLFSKKIAMGSLLALSASFMMSFDQKSDDYGQSVQVYSNVQNLESGEDVAVTGLVRAAARYTVVATRNAIQHLTPELNQISWTVFAIQNENENTFALKNEKLNNLDL